MRARRRVGPPRAPGLAATLGLLALVAHPAAAQAPTTVTSSGIHGRVVDARSGQPVARAAVSIEPHPAGVSAGFDEGGAFAAATRATTTDDQGRYRFAGLTRGRYRLRVARLGYRSVTVDLRYERPADPAVSIALEVEAVELEPLTVEVAAPTLGPGSAGGSPPATDAVRAARRLLRERHVGTDTRRLTPEELVGAATLGEPDLLRALQRLPGVTADDDWSAEPWTRGAGWDETPVVFDGLPLHGTLHGGGLFTAVSPDLIGEAVFHPGVRPASTPPGAAGLVDLRTRPVAGPRALAGTAHLSVVSARLALRRPLGDRSGFALAARRSYIDAITRGEPLKEDRIPYGFHDLGGRWDQRLADGLHLEVSGLTTTDRVGGDLPSGGLRATRARWGNRLLRGTLELQRWGLRLRLTEGTSHFDAEVERAPFDPARPDLVDAPEGTPTESGLTTGLTSLSVAPGTAGGAPPPWEAGVESRRTLTTYDGAAAWPYPGATTEGALAFSTHRAVTSVWGRLRHEPVDGLVLALGLRLDAGDTGAGPDPGSALRWLPRLTAAWSPTGNWRLSAALGRQVQYRQAAAETGFAVGPRLVPAHLWLPAGGPIPAVSADLVTVGTEVWLGRAWLVTVNAFGRFSQGHVVPRPTPGTIRAGPVLSGRDLGAGWTRARGSSVGVEAGVRRLAGRWTGSLAWSFTRARRRSEGRSYPAPGERTHALDGAIRFRTGTTFDVGATLTVASGRPLTRFFAFRCPGDLYCAPPEAGAAPVVGYAEPPGSLRGPAYASLDLHLEKRSTLFGLPMGFYAQLRNVLDRANPSAYLGSVLPCVPDATCAPEDRFEAGMPRMPLVGLWIRL